MVTRNEIIDFCDVLLEVDKFTDYGPIGLQVLGKDEVKKVVTGVTVSRELLQEAAAAGADVVIVHHGEFWNDMPQVITKERKERLRVLFEHDMTLLSYHLPLDAHSEIGNNAQLIKKAGFTRSSEAFGEYHGNSIGGIGLSREGIARQEFIDRMVAIVGHEAVVLPFGPEIVKRVGFVSGGGASNLLEAVQKRLDTFVTGESKEFSYHLSKEAGVNVIYLGHHNTEMFGIQTLGQRIAAKFRISVQFIDVPCPL